MDTDPSRSFRMTLYRPSSLRTGGRKRIFILFFCVIPPNQYPPSGFAGHLLINKEAYPIPILPVRIPFLNTVANPLLALWMTPYRLRSFWTVARMLCKKDGKQQHDTEWRTYDSDDILRLSSPRQQILHIRFGWRLAMSAVFISKWKSCQKSDFRLLTAFSYLISRFPYLFSASLPAYLKFVFPPLRQRSAQRAALYH